MSNTRSTTVLPDPGDEATDDRMITTRLNLTDPDALEGSDVVIFDGNCQFCQKQVVRLNWFDGRQRLSFISLHDPRVAERYPELSHDQLMEQMYVIAHNGTRYGGARAIRYLSRRLPRLWWVAPLLHIPFSAPLWQWAYQQVALRRYRLNKATDEEACDSGGCEIHFRK